MAVATVQQVAAWANAMVAAGQMDPATAQIHTRQAQEGNYDTDNLIQSAGSLGITVPELGGNGAFAPTGSGGQAQEGSTAQRTITTLLTRFRNSQGTMADRQELYEGLFNLGHTAEQAKGVVDNEVANKLPEAGDFGALRRDGGGGALGAGGFDPAIGNRVPGIGSFGGGPGDPLAGQYGASGTTLGSFAAAPRPGLPNPFPISGVTGGLGPLGDTAALSPEEGLRRDAFVNQGEEDVYRRVGGELFGPSTGLQKRVLDSLVNRFRAFHPITQFGTQDDDPNINPVEAQFRRFAAAPRPSGIDLGNQLAKIFATASPSDLDDAFGPDPGDEQGTFEEIQRAVRAGSIPFVQRLSPFVRSRAARGIEERFRQMFAEDPTQLQGVGGVFRELQRRKYLPTYSGATFGGRPITPEAAGFYGGDLFR